MQYDLSTQEAAFIDRMRLTPDQRNIQALTAAENARQRMVARMTPEQRAAYEAARTAHQAEQARVAGLTPDQRAAEQLVAQRVQVEADLAKPEIAAVVAVLVDGKVPVDVKPGPLPLPVKEV